MTTRRPRLLWPPSAAAPPALRGIRRADNSADQKWTFLFYFTEDGSTLVACARLQRWVERSPFQEFDPRLL
ncbi:hypothetical protein ACWCQQ_30515 [Streptomyces sp. NPDC002143]